MMDRNMGYKSRIPEIMKELDLNKKELSEHYQDASHSALYRWAKGEWPPLNVLLQIAKEDESNIAYILGITDVKHANESYAEPKLRLGEALKDAKMTYSRLAEKIGTSARIIKEYVDEPRFTRVSTLVHMADALGVSIDYLLGLTNVKAWEKLMISEDPFYYCQPGEPAWIASPDGGGTYCLMHEDGVHIISPNGSVADKNDEIFEGSVAYPAVEMTNEDDAISRLKTYKSEIK